MGLFDKLLFWKKEERPAETGFEGVPSGPGLSAEGLSPPEETVPFGMPAPSFPEPVQQRMGPSTFASHARTALEPEPRPSAFDDLSLISAKLDTIKAQLDAVLQRLERLEYSKEEHAYQRRWR